MFYSLKIAIRTGFVLGVAAILLGLVVTVWNMVKGVSAPHVVSEPFSFPEEKRYVQELLTKNDPTQGYAIFVKTYEKNIASDAHNLAHVVGGILYRRFGIDGLAYCDGHFEWGCYHGVMSLATGADVAPIEVCRAKTGDAYQHCLHGIGHGLLATRTYTVEGLNDALRMCDSFGDVFTPCADGVFMEYNTGQTSGLLGREPPSLTATRASPYEPCSQLPRKYQADCYKDQPPRWFSLLTQDPKEIAALCSSVAGNENRLSCYRGIARITPQGKSKEDILREFCEEIVQKDGYVQCREELGV